MSATRTRVCSSGARWKSRETGAASPPGITVTVATTPVDDKLAMMTVSSARPSDVDVPSAQYHAVDAASAAGTLTPRTAATATELSCVDDEPCWITTAATIAPITTT